MITRRAIIPFKKLTEIGNGFMVMQYLRGCGIDPYGRIHRVIDKKNKVIVYTERRGKNERLDN